MVKSFDKENNKNDFIKQNTESSFLTKTNNLKEDNNDKEDHYVKEMNDIVKKIKLIISSHFNCNIENIKFGTNLYDNLDADAYDMVDLIIALEDEFNIEITDDVAHKITTFDDIVTIILKIKDFKKKDIHSILY